MSKRNEIVIINPALGDINAKPTEPVYGILYYLEKCPELTSFKKTGLNWSNTVKMAKNLFVDDFSCEASQDDVYVAEILDLDSLPNGYKTKLFVDGKVK